MSQDFVVLLTSGKEMIQIFLSGEKPVDADLHANIFQILPPEVHWNGSLCEDDSGRSFLQLDKNYK